FPNRVLKRPSADNTARATVWNDRSRPELSAFYKKHPAKGVFLLVEDGFLAQEKKYCADAVAT
ncbi:hypothetical protein KA012_04290, partial [Candidatus Woesebacteria bacterium]|nr:hypothetical protein [Candidatus Woesebacteria bacterium]